MNVDIMAVGAHPDDIELSCSGTLLKAIAQGNKVALVDLTQGELGTRGSGPLRLKEAEKAKELMGAIARVNLGLKDGFFEESEDQLLALIIQIRRFRPQVLFANAISDRHPDHKRGSDFVSRASFLSGLKKISSSYDGVNQEAWRPKVVYHYIQDRFMRPDFVVDISSFIDKKLELVMAFQSQFFDPESKEPETPISGKSFLDYIKANSMVQGRYIGAEYGEGFKTERPIGVENLFDLM